MVNMIDRIIRSGYNSNKHFTAILPYVQCTRTKIRAVRHGNTVCIHLYGWLCRMYTHRFCGIADTIDTLTPIDKTCPFVYNNKKEALHEGGFTYMESDATDDDTGNFCILFYISVLIPRPARL